MIRGCAGSSASSLRIARRVARLTACQATTATCGRTPPQARGSAAAVAATQATPAPSRSSAADIRSAAAGGAASATVRSTASAATVAARHEGRDGHEATAATGRGRIAGAAPRSLSAARVAARPRWCRPRTDADRAPEDAGDLLRGQADDVAQDDDVALVGGQGGERLAQGGGALAAGLVGAGVRRADLLARHAARPAEVVDGGVVRHPQDPRGERRLAPLVAGEDRQKLGEDVLRDVLGLMGVAQDPLHVRVDRAGVAAVEGGHRIAVALLGQLHPAVDQELALQVACGPPARPTGVRPAPPEAFPSLWPSVAYQRAPLLVPLRWMEGRQTRSAEFKRRSPVC